MISLTNIKRIFLWALLSVLCTYNPITHINTFAASEDGNGDDTKDDSSDDGDETGDDGNDGDDTKDDSSDDGDETGDDGDDGDGKITIDEVKGIAAKLKSFADEVIKEAQNKNPTSEQRLRTYIFKKIPVIFYTDGRQNIANDEGIKSILSLTQIAQCFDSKSDYLIKTQEKSQFISLFGALNLISGMDPSRLDDVGDNMNTQNRPKNQIASTNRTIVMSTNGTLLGMLSNDFVKNNTSKNVQDSLKAMFKPYKSIVGVGKKAIQNSHAKELDKNPGSIWKSKWLLSKKDSEMGAFYVGVLVSDADTDIHKKLLANKPSNDPKDKNKSQGWSSTYVGGIAFGTLALGTMLGYLVSSQNASQAHKKSNITSLLDEDDE